MKKSLSFMLSGLLALGAISGAAILSKSSAEPVATKAESASVSTFSELETALATADQNTVITVTASILINNAEDLILDGKGCTLTVPTPYVEEDGSLNSSASPYWPLNIVNSYNVSLRNMIIIGGNKEAVRTYNATVSLENVSITRSRGGMMIQSSSLVALTDCNIVRNVSGYGAGLLVDGDSKVVMDRSSLSENYTTGSGGGAIEVKNNSSFYVNNSVITNNCSAEIGGAINCYGSNVYLVNSTCSGNVTTNPAHNGGAIGLNLNGSATFSSINSVLNDNYGDNGVTRSDIGIYNLGSSNSAEIINSVYGAIVPRIASQADLLNKKDVKEDLTATFGRKYRTDGAKSKDGYTDHFEHPVAIRKQSNVPSLYVPINPEGEAASGGIKTYFDYSDMDNVKIGYFDGEKIVAAANLTAPEATAEVKTYFEGGRRDVRVMGASAPTKDELYTVSIDPDALIENGYISGVSVYGDTYLKGTEVTITGIADSGYGIKSFTLNDGEDHLIENENPYTFVVDKDYIVSAEFDVGFELSYDANGGTGSVPPTAAFATSNYAKVSARPSSLAKAGCVFTGWNTQADGLGNEYNPGDLIELDVAKTLYAQWLVDATTSAVVHDIDAIGEVTLDKEDTINSIREAYEDLTPAQKALVDNYSALTDAEDRIAEIKQAKADAQAVDTLISAIGEVKYPTSEKAIDDSRKAYDALSDEGKEFVENYETLTDAEAEYNAQKAAGVDAVEDLIDAIGEVTLDSEDEITAARNAFNTLTDEQKALVENSTELTAAENRLAELKQAKLDAQAVDNLISAIGEVNYPTSGEEIAAARDAYDDLSIDGKSFVQNYSTLTNAETEYNSQKIDGAEAVEDLIDSIGNVTLSSEKVIADARAVYNALTDEQISLVDNYSVLTTAEARLAELKEAYADAQEVEELISAISEVKYPTSEKAIDDARKAYDALSDDGKEFVENYKTLTDAETEYDNQMMDAVDAVEELIHSIGEIKYPTSSDEIDAAREAYDALSDGGKSFVENYETLTDAETEYNKQKIDGVEAVENLIEAIGEVTLEKENQINSAKTAFDALTEEQKALVDNKDVLDAAIEELALLKHQEDVIDNGVQVTGKDGDLIPVNVTLKVELKTEVKAEQGSAEYSKISSMLGENEQISAVFDVKLLQTEGDVVTEIQPSDIKEGMIIIVEITLPDGLNVEGLRVLHIHSEDDIAFVNNFTINGNKLVFETDRLSEIAFVTYHPVNAKTGAGLPGWAIALIVIGAILVTCCLAFFLLLFVFNKWVRDEKDEDKAHRVFPFAFGEKDGKKRLYSFPWKFYYREKEEIYKSKKDALKDE